MRARCGDGRALSSDAVGNGSGRARGIDEPRNKESFVGPILMKLVTSSGTLEGKIFSTIVKEGSSSTVVGSE